MLPSTMNWTFGTAGSAVLTVVAEDVSECFYCRHDLICGNFTDLWELLKFKTSLSHCFYGAPGEIRTPDLVVRSHALYPTELRARFRKRARILACRYHTPTGPGAAAAPAPKAQIRKCRRDKGPQWGPLLSGGEGGIRTLDGAINPILP